MMKAVDHFEKDARDLYPLRMIGSSFDYGERHVTAF